MFSAWARLAAALTLSLALVAAPCKNCQPQPQTAEQQDCGHDCCPKPKPAQNACSWQPADFDAVEKVKDTSVSVPTLVELPQAPLAFAPRESGPAQHWPALDPSPPPIYLSTSSLRL